MMIIKALKPIFHNGQIVEVGERFACKPDIANRYIDGKVAEQIKTSTNPKLTKAFLESKTKAELLVLAKDIGVSGVNDSNKKDEIMEAILKAGD